MKRTPRLRLIVSLIITIYLTTHAQPSGAVQYLGHFTSPSGGTYVSGCWGWTDTTTGREYALLGNEYGTSIVEITNPSAMVERDFIPGPRSGWRELQVYQHYAYVVSEGGGGTQIIDLSYLPDSAHLVKNFIYTQGSRNTQRTHSNHIRDGYLYLNGCANWSPGGIVIFSLADPENPSYKSAYTGRYIHDCYVRNDTIYGAAINVGGVDIIDVRSKTNPILLNRITYTGAGTHNCATTADGRYLLTTDEIGTTPKTLKIWSLTTPPTFPKVAEYQGNPTAIVHNVFVRGNLAIMSYYTAGLKVVDITNPESPVEIGGYDTYPSSNAGSYAGAWSTYPFFPSKRIIIGDMQSGLYVVDIKPTIPKSPTQLQGFSDFSTPTSIQLTWQDPHQTILDDTLNNYNLQLYRNAGLIAQVDSGVQSFLDSGLVNHQYYTYTLRAKNLSTGDLSAPIQISDYAGGHPQPKSPTLFGSRDASDGAELSWKNPSEQIDETPLNDLAYILIYRDGFLYDSISQNSLDTSQIRSYFDSTSGYHTYRIRARDNETPTNFSTYTDSLLGYGGVLTSYSESFEGGRGSIFKTGLWDTTRWLASDGAVSLTDSRGVQYTNNSNTYFLTPSILVGNHPANAGLQFSHIVITYPGDWAILEISNDQRLTFTELKRYSWLSHPGWEDGTADQSDWFTDRFDLTSYDGDTVTFRFRLQTNPAIIADGWYIDNIKVGTGDTVTTTSTVVDNSWNLVSLPLIVPDGRTSTLFPTATSSAFAYEGGYAAKDTLQHGNGYWLKFDSTMTIDLTGVPLRKDTIDVNARWNLIGSLSYSFNASTVKSIPTGIITTSFYTFNGSYAPSFIIDPGKAYWVKTSQAGKIIFSSFSNLIAPSSPPQKKTIFEKLNTLLFTDRDGNLQTLYFGANIQEPMPLEQFELPPLPPRGTFDIRFSSQRNVEIAEKTSEKEFQIHAYSAQYPITVAWSIVDGDKSRWILFDDSTQITLERRGQFTFNELKNLSLRALNTHETRNPTSFKLKQNYPNPFNPTTVIQYAVTSTQFVSLKVFNVLGQELATLVNEEKHAGFYHVTFDASNLLSGVYYYRLTAGKFTDVKKILLLK